MAAAVVVVSLGRVGNGMSKAKEKRVTPFFGRHVRFSNKDRLYMKLSILHLCLVHYTTARHSFKLWLLVLVHETR